MVGISLEKEILRFNENILNLEDNVRLISNVNEENLDDVSVKIKELLDQYQLYDKLAKKHIPRLPLEHKHLDSREYPSYLALSLIHHDFNNIIQSISSYNSFINAYKEGCIEYEENVFDGKIISPAYKAVVRMISLLPYYVSGDKRYLLEVEIDETISSLRHLTDAMICCDFNNVESLKTNQYFSMYQLINNSSEAIDRRKKKNPNTEFDDIIKLTLEKSANSLVMTVADQGIGIKDYELPLVTGNFSTNGTGIGLQIIEMDMKLNRGYMNIISRHGNSRKYCYDTITRKIMPGKGRSKNKWGTIVELNYRL